MELDEVILNKGNQEEFETDFEKESYSRLKSVRNKSLIPLAFFIVFPFLTRLPSIIGENIGVNCGISFSCAMIVLFVQVFVPLFPIIVAMCAFPAILPLFITATESLPLLENAKSKKIRKN